MTVLADDSVYRASYNIGSIMGVAIVVVVVGYFVLRSLGVIKKNDDTTKK